MQPFSNPRPQSSSARDALEEQKLEAEIRLIEVQIEAERDKLRHEQSARRRTDWRGWIPILLSAVTVFVTGATVGIEFKQFLSNRVREYDVKLNEHMIELAQKLADPNTTTLQSNTDAVLLSAFEQDALPLLFAHLRAATAESQEPILHALELIQRKQTVKPGTVTRALLAEARPMFARYAADVQGTANYVTALGRLASDDEKGALGLLAELQQQVHRDGGAPAGILRPMVEQACRQLTGKDCS